MKHKQSFDYNPFTVALTGINRLFKYAQGVAFLLIIASILSLFSGVGNGGGSESDKREMQHMLARLSVEDWLLIGAIVLIILLATIFVSTLVAGMKAYTSVQVAKGKKVALGEAFNVTMEYFFSFLWLKVIVFVKIFLWTLLFIIPGVIMAVRYSYADMVFFDKKRRGNAAVKESLALTKGMWLTVFGSQTLFNMITLGVISGLVTAGANTILYPQLQLLKGKSTKPEAHWLSWLTLVLIFIAVVVWIIGAILLYSLAGAYGITW